MRPDGAPPADNVEQHPLEPFLPSGARLLMLGSFPPAQHRWCIHFFYPNYTNDMWRIMGLCFYNDKLHFVDEEQRTFRREDIVRFLTERGIALYDTAQQVVRTRNTAADKDLQVVTATDLDALLAQLPQLQALATTGEKATALCAEHFGVQPPRVGQYVTFSHHGRALRLYRMPSSSRAYPMSVEKKAAFYLPMFREILSNNNTTILS